MTSRRWPLIVVVALWAVTSDRLMSVWPRLPARMASHFSGRGQADGWMSRGGFVALWLGMTFAVTLLLFTISSLIPWGLMNLPNKDYWSDPARQQLARRRLALWCAWFAVGLNVLMASVLELVLRANLMAAPRLPGAHLGLLVGFFIFVAGMLAVLYLQFRRPRGA